MPKTPLTAALCLATLLSLAAATPPAHASHDDWFVLGGAFRVGHFSFSILVGDPGPEFPYGYYYRTPQRLAYRGYHCTSACLLRDGYVYHHDSCPVLAHHLAVYRFDPFDLHYQFAPPHPVWFHHHFDRRLPQHWHHRHDRFDRREDDRHRGDRRWLDRDDDRHDRWDRGERNRDRHDRGRRDRDRGDHHRDRRHRSRPRG
jgi:hypothetical protein